MKPQVVKYMLMAQEMDRAIAFYRDTMGFEECFSTPYWSELKFGDAILALHGDGDGTRNETGLSIQYEDVRSAFDTALEAGATPVQSPEQREGEPIILASICDHEGNILMLTQNVGTE